MLVGGYGVSVAGLVGVSVGLELVVWWVWWGTRWGAGGGLCVGCAGCRAGLFFCFVCVD